MLPPMFYLEDLSVGAEFRTVSVEVTAAMIHDFAQQFDPQPFHLDPEAAKSSVFGQLVASGWHTAALTMRLLVEGDMRIANGLVGLGIERVAWPRPVLPGDTLHATSTVLDIRPSQSRPDRGVVKTHNRTFNQRDEIVQDVVVNMLVLRRPA